MKQLRSSFYHGIIELLLTFPLVLMAGVLLVGTERLWGWLFSLWGLFFIGTILRFLWPQKKWWFYILLAICLELFPTWLFSDIWYIQILLAIIQMVFVFRGLTYLGNSSALPLLFMWYSGLLIYFASYFLFRYHSLFQPYLSVFSLCGIILIGIILFISNDETLKASTLSQEQSPVINRTIQRQNRLFLIGTFLVIIAISNFGKIREWLWDSFRALMGFIFRESSDKELEPMMEEGASSSPMMPELPTGEKSAFAEFLDMVMTYIAYVVVVVILILALLLLVKKVRQHLLKLFRKFIAKVKEIFGRSSMGREMEQYIDEKENIFDWQAWRGEQQAKVKQLMGHLFNREVRYESLSNQEKARFIYRKLVEQQAKGMDIHHSMTPREVLRKLSNEQNLDLLRDTYEQVRYGEQDIEVQTLQTIYKYIK
ncbi:DUF4129 domain-containing protein [Lederbergia galactosidilytica]|uniref:Protein-glutamine gamma-glutamyltransferase-like C-terminal domain-containing protein n=2 Tax=Lederbergia galactosidilytica TaxID=217031 RepID=A0A177ZUL9_9BACI|nr:DUF4129 domain-containing protein [Lederbergia galactosidilytica]KRG14995.1 hypothetical protein ACA30_07315 [Virgibacillus soli]MBP1913410.1 hypothetical protein [Lederbergia galactosidilytica]OAK71413.1 hypothetical protein ABB05_10605 [Lederbergia galactosidilytica]